MAQKGYNNKYGGYDGYDGYSNYGGNNNNNNKYQIQEQIYKQDETQIVVETQLTLDQLDACFNALDKFYKILKNNNTKKQFSQKYIIY